MQAPENAALPQTTDPLVRRGRRESDVRSDCLDRRPRVILQNAQYGEVYSVKFDNTPRRA